MKFEKPLLITTVAALLKQTLKHIASSSKLDIDLSNVPDIDSAGIAFLLELKAIAKQKNCHLIFSNTPTNIDKLCQLYQVTL